MEKNFLHLPPLYAFKRGEGGWGGEVPYAMRVSERHYV